MKPPGSTVAGWVYRALLRLLPSGMYRAHGRDAAEAFDDLYRAEYRRGGWTAAFGVCVRAVIQVVGTAGAERWERTVRTPSRTRPGDRGRPRRLDHVATVVQDVRFAFRTYAKRPGFSLMAAGILALGIGASTTIFSVVDTVVLRALPYPDPHELVFFDEGSHPVPDFRDWLDRTTAFDQLAAAWTTQMDLTNEGQPTRVTVARVTGDFFPMFGVRPLLGRLPAAGETGIEGTGAVVSYEFWRSRWGADSTVIGRMLELDGAPVEVIGVGPPRFHAPRRMVRRETDLWIPLDVTDPDLQQRGMFVLGVVGRLAPAVPLARARAQIDTWRDAAAREFPDTHMWNGAPRPVPLIPLHEATVGGVSGSLYMLLGAVGLMLLIACANVANLFLAQGLDREREIALRSALGASRPRLMSQMLTESVALSAIGGAAGVLLAYVGVGIFPALNPDGIPRVHEIAVDYRILGFAVAISIATGILFGIAPAWYAVRSDVNATLKESTVHSSTGHARLRLKNALVVAEIALALVLLVGAGLLFNSFLHLTRVDPGFASKDVVVMPLLLGPAYEPEGRRAEFSRALIDQITAVPGITHATAAVTVPFTVGGRCCFMSQMSTSGGSDSSRVVIHPVGPDYFRVLGVPLMAGRELTWEDGRRTPSVAVITRRTAERFFADRNPMGETVVIGTRNPTPYRVVGVINDLKHWSLARDDDVDVYIPYVGTGDGIDILSVAVRTAGGTAVTAAALRDAVWRLDPRLPVPEVFTLRERIRESVTEPRFFSTLLVTFAAIAVTLAAAGIYGTMLYAVSQRNREFGIRVALGANAGQLLRQVVTHGAGLTALGLFLGLIVAGAASRVLEARVFGITTSDATTYGAVTALLGVVALAACYVPGRRAARTDPIGALRSE